MTNDETERLLVEIGQFLAMDVGRPISKTLLYAEVGHNFVGPSIYKEMSNHIRYERPDLRDLGDALLKLWEAQDTNDRWEEIEYILDEGRFDVTFTYPDEIDRNEDPLDRRDRIVQSYFGDKPIVYPASLQDDGPQYQL